MTLVGANGSRSRRRYSDAVAVEGASVTNLEIDEELPGKGGRQQFFAGWMFASSPALSALEHSVYDVWVIDCSTVAEVKDLPERLKSPTTDKAEANRE